MVKINRRPGRRVNFDSKIIEKPVLKEEEEIKEKFLEIKQVEKKLIEIQSKNNHEREERITQKEIELKKILDLWDDLNRIDLNILEKNNLIKIINSQKNFIQDFLKHYINSTKNEKNIYKKSKELNLKTY
jgi:hypothetical protein